MRRFAFLPLLTLPLLACQQAAPLQIKDAWTRDTVGRSASAAVYMTITSPTADRLISASTPVAKKTDLMTMVGDSNAMEMMIRCTVLASAMGPARMRRSSAAGLARIK